MTKRRATLTMAAAFTLLLAAGCHHGKKTATPPPPPAAPPPAATNKPTINYFNAEPSTINSGQPSTLRWSVSDATSVTIDNGIGPVSPNGRRAVYPTGTMTYNLTATGPGGDTALSATITVSGAAPVTAAPPAPPALSAQDILSQQVKDLHFDYDKSDVRAEDQPLLQADANALKQIFATDSNFIVTIEGHCDERGSAEYNLALGDRRASATKDALTGLGVPGDKLKTVSYGKERPICTDDNETCYGQNRRAHFSAGQ